MITAQQISKSNLAELQAVYAKLSVDRMKLDRFFTVFLDNAVMDQDDPDSDDWITYREMLKNYDQVKSLIKTTEYYLQHA